MEIAAAGGHNLLIANPRDIPAFIKELQSFKAHVFPGLNTLFNAMMNNPEFKKIDFSSLMLVLGGGMAIQRPVAERWLDMTGRPITEGYGLSETSPVATVNRLDVREFTGMIGLPLPSTDIEIREAPCERREYETHRKKRIPLDDCVGAIAEFCDCRVWREKDQAGEGRYVYFGLRADVEAARFIAFS